MDWFAELKRDVAASMVLPAGRFFTPTEDFFGILQSFGDIQFIDAGCGQGHVAKEAKEFDIKMLGVDMVARVGQEADVLHIDALSLPYNATVWPVICRPNHDGWAYDLVKKALNGGAKALYVGLERNVEQDLDELQLQTTCVYPDVGADGECMWVLEGPLLTRWQVDRMTYEADPNSLHPCYD